MADNSKETAKLQKTAKRKVKKSAKKAWKKMHPATVFVAVLCLVIGIAAGGIYAVHVSKNDRFQLIGESAYSVDAGTSFTYREEGVEAVCFGRDVSGKVHVETTLQKDAAGNYIIPTDKEGVYTITYTVDAFKFGEDAPNGVVKRIRTFTVSGSEEDGRYGED